MKREELLRSENYWKAQFQMILFETVEDYLKENNLTRSAFADQIGVNKSYITQVLNGDFDHKISKFVEILMACKKAPVFNVVSLEDYIANEEDNKPRMTKSPKSSKINSQQIQLPKSPAKKKIRA